jgi:hypothetical protein
MPPLLRRAVRLGLALLVILPLWGLISLVAQAGLRDPGGLPLARVSSEALTLLIAVWAAAAVTERFVPERFGGLAAGPILIVLIAVVAAAPFLPGHVRMLPATQRAAGWSHAHVLWLRVLVTAAVVLFLFSRDPGRARLRALAHAASS